jgi:hypothetical protein
LVVDVLENSNRDSRLPNLLYLDFEFGRDAVGAN